MKNRQTLFLLFLLSAPSQGVVTLSEANFDGINTTNNGNGAGAVTITGAGIPAPAGSSGEVGSIDISGGTTPWGAVNHSPDSIAISATSVPGVDTFIATMNVFIPSGTTFNTAAGSFPDRINIILRWNDVNTNTANVNSNWSDYTLDTWTPITVSGTLPINGGDGNPLATVTPILSFYDVTNDAAAGTAVFIDDWSFTVTESIPEPSTIGLSLLAGLALIRRRR